MDAARYLANHFLIALPSMEDPNFSRGVTLVCQHTAEGAMGLLVNRLSDYILGDVLEQMNIRTRIEHLATAPVLLGGPLQPERGFVLHTPGPSWDSTYAVSDVLSLTTSRDVLEAMAEGKGPAQGVVALGYAGWGENQLEGELQDNAWLTVEADSSILFSTPIEDRWMSAARLMGVDMTLLTAYAGHA